MLVRVAGLFVYLGCRTSGGRGLFSWGQLYPAIHPTCVWGCVCVGVCVCVCVGGCVGVGGGVGNCLSIVAVGADFF